MAWDLFILAHENQWLEFQKFYKLFVLKIEYKNINHIKMKVINTQNSSFPNNMLPLSMSLRYLHLLQVYGGNIIECYLLHFFSPLHVL